MEELSKNVAKAAFARWNNRIAPVFDVARSIQLVSIKAGQIVCQSQAGISRDILNLKAWSLAELEVETLVCGAISRPLQAMIASFGIEVIPFVAGDLQEVIQAWIDGELSENRTYAMPGCRNTGGGRGFNEVNGINRRTQKMNGNKRGNKGAGQGSGFRGQGNRGKGCTGQGRNGLSRGGGSRAFSKMGDWVCPACGHLESHSRGTPCMHLICAQCGAVMTKQ